LQLYLDFIFLKKFQVFTHF